MGLFSTPKIFAQYTFAPLDPDFERPNNKLGDSLSGGFEQLCQPAALSAAQLLLSLSPPPPLLLTFAAAGSAASLPSFCCFVAGGSLAPSVTQRCAGRLFHCRGGGCFFCHSPSGHSPFVLLLLPGWSMPTFFFGVFFYNAPKAFPLCRVVLLAFGMRSVSFSTTDHPLRTALRPKAQPTAGLGIKLG